MLDVHFERDIYMDLGRFLKLLKGCFFAFYKVKGNDIVCNKLKQCNLFEGRKGYVCLFGYDTKQFKVMNKSDVAGASENTFIGSFYDFAYAFLKENNVGNIDAYKTEKYVTDIISDLLSKESILKGFNAEDIKKEFYKEASERLYKAQTGAGEGKSGLSEILYNYNFGKDGLIEGSVEILKDKLSSMHSNYLRRKRQLSFLDGEDILILLYQQLKIDPHLRVSFSRLLKNVFVLDFSTLTFLQRIILQECFSSESLYFFLFNDGRYLSDDFRNKMSESFPGCFFLNFSSFSYSMYVFECANKFLEHVDKNYLPLLKCDIKNSSMIKGCVDASPTKRRRCDTSVNHVEDNEKFITFLSSTIESREVDLISLVIKKIMKEGDASCSDIIVFATGRDCDTVMKSLRKDGLEVSVGGGRLGVRVVDIKEAKNVDNIMNYVFIYGLSSTSREVSQMDFYFALLSAAKKVFLSYSLMRNLDGKIVNLVKSEFIDMLDTRFVNEDVLTASKISLCSKEYVFDSKATVFSYSFIKKKSVIVRK